jgi:HD-like signal output (HDOD) protein
LTLAFTAAPTRRLQVRERTVTSSPAEAPIEIPSPPGLALALLRLGDDPMLGGRDLVRVASEDAALCLRAQNLLRLPSFGGDHPRSLLEACVLVGLPEALGVLTGLALQETLPVGPMRRTGLRVALFAHDLARAADHRDLHVGSDAFIAGCVHDLGRAALGLGEERPESPPTDGEVAQFGVDHPRVGAAVLRGWGLSGPVVRAVAAHHDAPRKGDDLVTRAVRLAVLVDRRVRASIRIDEAVRQVARCDDARQLGLDEQHLHEAAATLGR